MNVLDSDLKISGDVQIGNVASPPSISGGAGAMTTTNKPDGAIHLRTDDVPEVKVGGSVQPLGLGQHCVELRVGDLPIGANWTSTTTYKTYMPRKGKITGISRRFTLDPVSTLGTVVTNITVAGNAVLVSASENEEGIGDNVLVAYNLTGTTAYLSFAKGDVLILSCVSNNVDLTAGTGMYVYVYYEDK
jgi:hypothetical protein